jgi:hypothetical protein
LTLAGMKGGPSSPIIQLSDDNPTGKAETHIRGLKLVNNAPKRPIIDTGVGPKPTPKTPTSVPIYVHDYFGPGIDAKVVRVKSGDLTSDGLNYAAKPPLTGRDVLVAETKGTPFPKLLDPIDDLPPATVITHVIRKKDNGKIAKVVVNGQIAQPLRPNFAEWHATVDAAAEVAAYAEDSAGNIERTPHRVRGR